MYARCSDKWFSDIFLTKALVCCGQKKIMQDGPIILRNIAIENMVISSNRWWLIVTRHRQDVSALILDSVLDACFQLVWQADVDMLWQLLTCCGRLWHVQAMVLATFHQGPSTCARIVQWVKKLRLFFQILLPFFRSVCASQDVIFAVDILFTFNVTVWTPSG